MNQLALTPTPKRQRVEESADGNGCKHCACKKSRCLKLKMLTILLLQLRLGEVAIARNQVA
ncbi:hypothetical protein E2562_015982 [Oryza meyeriana var. granulata]|uniref:CRC domain-containing protein n=1 Tax=Oryza meyeriana var. granulata TaxID=110450 RepID=A0A6G1ELH1_9ORYZ|nr:hypothetical protein E2562_015982 [Oryza meyeriana var. granulata]